ncbi:MAG: hypothetical protein KTR30_30820 [Saprospiraceae bacterium]|nr:hypothetical protein [Saprospiraceae bacterium]
MLKLFRRVRHKLLAKNRFSKYLLYAGGEIILVVIGILIAVQLNNGNEVRKSNKELDAIWKTILVEIETDLPKIDRYITYLEQKTSLMDSVIQNQIPSERLFQCYNCLLPHVTYDILSLENKGVNNLRTYTARSNTKNETLVNEVIECYNFFDQLYTHLATVVKEDAIVNGLYFQNEADYISPKEYYEISHLRRLEAEVGRKLYNDQRNMKTLVRHCLVIKQELGTLKRFKESLQQRQIEINESIAG